MIKIIAIVIVCLLIVLALLAVFTGNSTFAAKFNKRALRHFGFDQDEKE